jgi:hypothetical protein
VRTVARRQLRGAFEGLVRALGLAQFQVGIAGQGQALGIRFVAGEQ